MRRGRRRRPRNLRLRDRPAAPRERGRPHRRKHPKVPAVATPASSRPVGNWPPRTGSRPAPGRCPACRPRPGRPVGSFGGFCFFPPTGGLPSRGAAAAAAAAGEPNTIQKRTRSHRQERRRSPWPKRRRGIGRKTALPASPTNPAGGSAVSSDHPRGRRTGPTRRPPRVVHAAPAGGRPRDRQDTLSRSGKRLFCLSTKGRVASGNPPSGGEVLTVRKWTPPPLPSVPPALVGPARKGSKNGGTHFLKRRPFLRGTRRAPACTTQSDPPPAAPPRRPLE